MKPLPLQPQQPLRPRLPTTAPIAAAGTPQVLHLDNFHRPEGMPPTVDISHLKDPLGGPLQRVPSRQKRNATPAGPSRVGGGDPRHIGRSGTPPIRPTLLPAPNPPNMLTPAHLHRPEGGPPPVDGKDLHDPLGGPLQRVPLKRKREADPAGPSARLGSPEALAGGDVTRLPSGQLSPTTQLENVMRFSKLLRSTQAAAASSAFSPPAAPVFHPSLAPLAAYIAVKATTGHTLTDEQVQRVRAATQVVQAVREQLSLGAANRPEDIEESNGMSHHRKVVLSRMKKDLSERINIALPTESLSSEAAFAAVAQAGVCSDFAAIAMMLYGKDMLKNEELVMWNSFSNMHGWAEAHLKPEGPYEKPKPGQAQGEPPRDYNPLILDPWSDGIPHFADDASGIYKDTYADLTDRVKSKADGIQLHQEFLDKTQRLQQEIDQSPWHTVALAHSSRIKLDLYDNPYGSDSDSDSDSDSTNGVSPSNKKRREEPKFMMADGSKPVTGTRLASRAKLYSTNPLYQMDLETAALKAVQRLGGTLEQAQAALPEVLEEVKRLSQRFGKEDSEVSSTDSESASDTESDTDSDNAHSKRIRKNS